MGEVVHVPGQNQEELSPADALCEELLINVNRVITEALSRDTSDTTNYTEVEQTVAYLKTGIGNWFEVVEVLPQAPEDGKDPETKEHFAYRILDALENPPSIYAQTEDTSGILLGTSLKQAIARSDDFGNWALDMRKDVVAIQSAIAFDRELDDLSQLQAEAAEAV